MRPGEDARAQRFGLAAASQDRARQVQLKARAPFLDQRRKEGCHRGRRRAFATRFAGRDQNPCDDRFAALQRCLHLGEVFGRGLHELERDDLRVELPTALVTNQHSLSDAEDFTEGYRALKLGPVVGEPTAGWIIYTSNITLLDGTSVRVPFTRITDAEGTDMEMAPRPVDVPVKRPVGEWYTGRDAQLDAAVKELIGRLGRVAGR